MRPVRHPSRRKSKSIYGPVSSRPRFPLVPLTNFRDADKTYVSVTKNESLISWVKYKLPKASVSVIWNVSVSENISLSFTFDRFFPPHPDQNVLVITSINKAKPGQVSLLKVFNGSSSVSKVRGVSRKNPAWRYQRGRRGDALLIIYI